MAKTAKSNAEEKFAKTQHDDRQALAERAKLAQKAEEKINRLRALRLEKEAADKKAADQLAAEKAANVKIPKARKKAVTKDAVV